jgi:hypothetical protein
MQTLAADAHRQITQLKRELDAAVGRATAGEQQVPALKVRFAECSVWQKWKWEWGQAGRNGKR